MCTGTSALQPVARVLNRGGCTHIGSPTLLFYTFVSYSILIMCSMMDVPMAHHIYTNILK